MKREIYDCDRCGEACDPPIRVRGLAVCLTSTADLDLCAECAAWAIRSLLEPMDVSALAAWLRRVTLKRPLA